jgi:hypothetical protein
MGTKAFIRAATGEYERASRSVGRQTIIFGLCVAIVMAAFVAVVWRAIDQQKAAHARFMQQCMEDHKEYECTALWRAGNRSNQDVIVLPIPIPFSK